MRHFTTRICTGWRLFYMGLEISPPLSLSDGVRYGIFLFSHYTLMITPVSLRTCIHFWHLLMRFRDR